MPDPESLARASYRACDAYIEVEGDSAGTYCKLAAGHDGDHSAHFPADRCIDPHMRVTLYHCSECEQTSSDEAWQAAWWRERSRRMAPGSEYLEDDYGPSYGLDEAMVCPRCGYVHRDDECSAVDEVEGIARAA